MGANVNPTFYGEGHTPVNHNSAEIILQKILGAIIDNGNIQSGPSAATQPQVDACSSSTTYVSPATLCNWQLPYGFTKQGTTANTQSNWEPVTSKTVWVNTTYGNDTRTGLLKYNRDVPFKTIAAAVAVWASGDVVRVTPGVYAEKNIIIPEGFSCYHEFGANVTFSGVLALNDAIYTDNNVGLSMFNIRGDGAFSIHDTGNAQDGAVLRIRGGSFGRFECLSAVAGTSGTKGNAFWIDGNGIVSVSVKTTVSAQDNCFYTGTGNPVLIANVGQSVASPNSGFFCNAGTMYVGQCPLNTANLCMYVTATGTAIYHQVGTLSPSVNGTGVHGTCVGTISNIAGAAGVYGVDGPSSGTMNVVVGTISGITGADGRGITSRGAGTTYVTVLGSNTATIPVLVSAGTCTIFNGEHFGNNATATVQITNTGNAQRLNCVNSTLRNAHATGPVYNIADTTSINVLQGGCALIGQAGSTYSVDGSASTNLKCYGHSVANKTYHSANVSLLVGILEVDTDVT